MPLILQLSFPHHQCEFGGSDCIKSPSVEDKTAHKYSNRLAERVGTIYNYLKNSCNLPNLPPAPTKAPPTRSKTLRIGKLGKKENISTTSKLIEQHDVKIKKIIFP